jgi:hypothetical protein
MAKYFFKPNIVGVGYIEDHSVIILAYGNYQTIIFNSFDQLNIFIRNLCYVITLKLIYVLYKITITTLP